MSSNSMGASSRAFRRRDTGKQGLLAMVALAVVVVLMLVCLVVNYGTMKEDEWRQYIAWRQPYRCKKN